MKYLFKAIGYLFIIAFLFFGGIILYGTLTEYKPEPGSKLSVEIEGAGNSLPGDTIHFLNWNIGFGGLGAKMDFFYDGGSRVRAEKEEWESYQEGIIRTLHDAGPVDLFLLQEVDKQSKRSWFTDQFGQISKALPGYSASFGLNYNVQHVPLPFTNPLGKVYSGVATFSRLKATTATRYQYPGSFPWPTRIFFLDRCFLVHRIPLSNHELIVINTHNSAYDETGELKAAEMKMLSDFAQEEFSKGNYVVVGGDFNQCPPGFDPTAFSSAEYDGFIPPAMPEGFIPGDWQVVYDAGIPTNRHLNTPYSAGTSFTTLIDYYFVSPNVEVLSVRTMDLDFAYSDHQPVRLSVVLN